MIVFTFKGAIGKDDMDKIAHENIDTYIPWIIGNMSYGKVNPDISAASKGAFNYISPLILGHHNYSFVFIGHSYAGSIASLTALNVKLALKSAYLSLFTFGEPRYHNYKLAQTFQNNLSNGYRVVHNSDIVPHMPICGSTFSGSCYNNNSFYHRTQEIWYHNTNLQMNNGDQKFCSTSEGEDPSCSNSISEFEFLLNFQTARGTDMHMTYYNQKLDDYGLSGCGEIPCKDVDTDCATKIKECSNSLYKPVMCKYCKKTCNLCTDRTCIIN
uniref:ShKT domain-containing protein n=1 Tax=Panagrolaimus davidi TaxID=227884 RepID=A0A914P4B3_9BILA